MAKPGSDVPVWVRGLGLTIGVALTVCGIAGAAEPGFDLGLDELMGPTAPGGTLFADPDPARSPGMVPIRPLPESFNQPPKLPVRLRDDLGALATAPLRWQGSDWRRFGLGVALVGAVSLLDDEIDHLVDRTRSDSTVRAARTIRPLGQHGSFALIGGAWLLGRSFDRPGLAAAAEDALEASILAAGLITPALKAITGRSRPEHGHGAVRFGGDGQSFPSGEATQAFAIASVVAAHSERTWVKATAWSFAGLVGLSRLELDAHWASDVVAGALIGAAVGQWVVRRNRPELEGGFRFDLAPTIGRDRVGVSVAFSF